jgi:hypothetical protein
MGTNLIQQVFSKFVILLPPIILTFTAPLLQSVQVPVRMYGDSRNLNTIITSSHLQYCIQRSCTVMKNAVLQVVIGACQAVQ